MFEHCYNEFAKGDYWKLYPDVKVSLETLREKGYRLVVLSNWDKRLLRTLNELKLDNYFERIYISTLIGAAKPDPSAFQYMIKDLNVAPAEVLHIGDSPEEDITGALGAGIRPLCIDRNGNCTDGNSEFPIISSLSQLTV
jgi:putative hydrolase of the HAD superfamily